MSPEIFEFYITVDFFEENIFVIFWKEWQWEAIKLNGWDLYWILED
jgi:hypothetical protein